VQLHDPPDADVDAGERDARIGDRLDICDQGFVVRVGNDLQQARLRGEAKSIVKRIVVRPAQQQRAGFGANDDRAVVRGRRRRRYNTVLRDIAGDD
jgi:hypothetical protein